MYEQVISFKMTLLAEQDKNGNLLAKYPCRPSCKLCEPDVACPTWICSIEKKLLSSPPGKYGRKAET